VPAALEILDRRVVAAVEDSAFAAGYPRDAAAVLLVEVDGTRAEVDDAAAFLAARWPGLRRARDEAERAALWKGRKGAFGAMGRIAEECYVMDCVVPRRRMGEALARIDAIATERGLAWVNVFHAGDGNLHPLIAYDRADADRVHEAGRAIAAACLAVRVRPSRRERARVGRPGRRRPPVGAARPDDPFPAAGRTGAGGLPGRGPARGARAAPDGVVPGPVVRPARRGAGEGAGGDRARRPARARARRARPGGGGRARARAPVGAAGGGAVRKLSSACVHCGLRLPACPTYAVPLDEAESPRGRILLMEALAEGRAAADDVRPHVDRCIGCVACESVCPSGVPYGALLEEGRAALGGPPFRLRFALRRLLERRLLVGAAARVARLIGRAPPRARRKHRRPGQTSRVAPRGTPRARVGLHLGCVTPALTDVTRLLLDEPAFPGARLAPLRVAWDAPCHLVHAQGVDAAPLLDRIPGVERVPLSGADDCCGAGGLHMQRQPGLARAVRAGELDALLASGAEAVASPNPGCLLWLWRGLKGRGAAVRVVHPVELLAEAWLAG